MADEESWVKKGVLVLSRLNAQQCKDYSKTGGTAVGSTANTNISN